MDSISYLTEEDLKPKPLTEIPDALQYLQKEDLETTPIENIIKMTRGYLNFDNPILYKLYLHFNPNLSKDKVKMIEDKIQELLELERMTTENINEMETLKQE